MTRSIRTTGCRFEPPAVWEDRTAGSLQNQLERHDSYVAITWTEALRSRRGARREYDRDKVFAAVSKREEPGWTFVFFLSANQDSYEAGHALGYDPRSVQNFAATPDGTRAAFQTLQRSAGSMRRKLARAESFDKGDFFEGTKEAEA